MRRIIRILSVALLCGALCAPVSAASDRNNHGGRGPQPTHMADRGHGKHDKKHDKKYDKKHNEGNWRPGNMKPHPGNHGGRPGNMKPHPNPKPVPPPHMGHRPPGHWPMMPPPHRRPMPPRRYVPYQGSMFGTILGVAIGTALNISLNSLINRGYVVNSYGNNAIYLSNVNQLNLLWPNATLYYTNGALGSSEFVYSTPYYDMSRYNQAYGMLVNSYGMPVATQQLAYGGMQADWWDARGQYVTLRMLPQQGANGTFTYFTTLSFGM